MNPVPALREFIFQQGRGHAHNKQNLGPGQMSDKWGVWQPWERPSQPSSCREFSWPRPCCPVLTAIAAFMRKPHFLWAALRQLLTVAVVPSQATSGRSHTPVTEDFGLRSYQTFLPTVLYPAFLSWLSTRELSGTVLWLMQPPWTPSPFFSEIFPLVKMLHF